MIKYLLAIFLAAGFAEHCLGVAETQTNKLPVKLAIATTNKPPMWKGTITLGLTATEGNVDSALATTKIMADRKTARDEWSLGADGSYGEVQSVKNSESAHAFAQYNHMVIDNTWYDYGRAEGWHDAIADITYRATASLGAGYYFIKDKQTSLSSEFGPGVEVEKLDGQHDTYPTARLAEIFEHKIDDHARVWENVELLPPLTSPDDFLINAEVGVETPLTHSISLQTYLQDHFANAPAPGFKDNDVKLVSGLVFKF